MRLICFRSMLFAKSEYQSITSGLLLELFDGLVVANKNQRI